MFAEYLKDQTWQTVMPGVFACNFSLSSQGAQLPPVIRPGYSEVLFCTAGELNLVRSNGGSVRIGSREILLFSDAEHLQSAQMGSGLEGICLSVDHSAAGDTFRDLVVRFGNLPLSMKRVGEEMANNGGFRVITVTPWSRAAFYALKHLPQNDQPNYCVMKTFEMLYLMCTQDSVVSVCEQDRGGSLTAVANGMKKYMEEHMDEKMTISDLSHRFHLSRTACKSCFRACFGQPIHSWLLDRRMERAAELLEHTKMPILQIAQSVGYTGVSQFNVAFRQRYGKSPREYRKMSFSSVF